MELNFKLNEIPDVAEKILSGITNKTLLFYGSMGVGKTTLIKEIARKLGITIELSSPTFAIVNEYELGDEKVYHFDCYRLNNEEEALDIGIEDYMETNAWKLIEWPQKIKRLIPEPYTKIELTINQNGSRTVKIMPVK